MRSKLRVAVLAGSVLAVLAVVVGFQQARDRSARGGAETASACAGRWAAGTRGRPPALRVGYHVWRDDRGWHVRTTPGRRAARFVASIATAEPLLAVQPVGIESPDGVTRGRRSIALHLRTAVGDHDGIDFRVRCGLVRFSLSSPAGPVARGEVAVGSRGRSPGATFAAPDPARSGVEGQVTTGSRCPVDGVPECPGSERKPVATTVDVTRGGGKGSPGTAGSPVRTDAEGKFRVDLPPGDYLLVPRPTDPSLSAGSAGAHVVPGLVTRVDLTLSSGIY